MAMNAWPSRSKRTSTLSRVVPATSLTIMRSLWARQLMKVLLPVLRRPTMASFSTASFGVSSPSGSGSRCRISFRSGSLLRFCWALTQSTLLLAELVKLGRLRIDIIGIALVGEAEDRFADVPQPFGDFLVERRQPSPAIDHEEDHVGLVDGNLDLPFDVGGEVIDVLDADAAGVDELEEAILDVDQGGDAIARDAGGGIDDGDAPAREPVEQR